MTERLVLLREPGARWEPVAVGPVLCVLFALVALLAGVRVPWQVVVMCAVLLAGVAVVPIVSRRRHASVELTSDALRNGTEVVPLAQVAAVLPARQRPVGELSWESARALGESPEVPRGRTAVGLRLVGEVEVRAWARDSEWLRVLLSRELEGRKGMTA